MSHLYMFIYFFFHCSESPPSPTSPPFFAPTPDEPPRQMHPFAEEAIIEKTTKPCKPVESLYRSQPFAEEAIVEKTTKITKPLPPIPNIHKLSREEPCPPQIPSIRKHSQEEPSSPVPIIQKQTHEEAIKPTPSVRKHSHEEPSVPSQHELLPPGSPAMRHRAYTDVGKTPNYPKAAVDEAHQQTQDHQQKTETSDDNIDPDLSPIMRHRAYTDIMLEVNMPQQPSHQQSMDDASILQNSPSIKQRSFTFLPHPNANANEHNQQNFPFQSFIPRPVHQSPPSTLPKPIPASRQQPKFPETQVRLRIMPDTLDITVEPRSDPPGSPLSQHRSTKLPPDSPLLQHPLL